MSLPNPSLTQQFFGEDMQLFSEANRSSAVSSLLSYLRLFSPPQGNRRAGDGRKVRGSRLRPNHVFNRAGGVGGGSLRCHADFLLQSGTSKERLTEGGVFTCWYLNVTVILRALETRHFLFFSFTYLILLILTLLLLM